MPDSRITDEQSRRTIREELLTNILVEAGAGSGKTQMLAERMAAGVAEGVYQIEHMAAVTFTRKAASELRGRFHLALEARLVSARKAKAPEAEIRRLQAALSNLERFFAGTIHSFCARLLRERPVESGVSPGFTELDEVQDLELRQRVWREFITSAREAGDPDVAALLEADIKLKDLDPAFATVCDNDDVEFPPGEGECPDPKPAAKALDRVLEDVPEAHALVDRRRHQVRDAAGGAAVRGAVARGAEAAPATGGRRCPARTVGPRVQDHDEMVVGRQSRGTEDPCGHRRPARGLSCGRGRAVSRRVAAVRLPAVDSPPHPRATCRLRRASSPELAELRRPAQSHRARAARERRRATGAPAEVPVPVGGRVPGHRSRAGRDRLLAGRGHGRRVDVEQDESARLAAGAASPRGALRRRATRSSRSTGSVAPTSTSTTSSAGGSARRVWAWSCRSP